MASLSMTRTIAKIARDTKTLRNVGEHQLAPSGAPTVFCRSAGRREPSIQPPSFANMQEAIV
jgi:hypothetical protein